MDLTAETTSSRPQPLASRLQRWFDDLAKRLVDIVVSLFGMLLLAPVFLLIAVAIRRDSPGPVFYRGPRLGRAGKLFRILKFRTMYEDGSQLPGATRHRPGRSARHPARALAAPDQAQRAAPALQRSKRRDEPGRAASRRPRAGRSLAGSGLPGGAFGAPGRHFAGFGAVAR